MRSEVRCVAEESRGRSRGQSVAAIFAVCALGGGAAAPAQESPNGEEFQVNSYTPSYQVDPAVAAGGQGNFVVTWQSHGSSGSDNSRGSVQAQRYASNGLPLGGEFQVNTFTRNYQASADVAMDAQDNFVIVWASQGSSGTDDPGPGPPGRETESIQARRYAADGVPLGGEVQVNTYTTNNQFAPSVAMDGQGNFVVAWMSDGSSGTDTSGFGIEAQRFDATGAALGGEFQVNNYPTSNQWFPGVAVDGQGNFVVVWTSFGSGGTDTSGFSIQARRYDAKGVALGGQFQVNTDTTNDQFDADVAADDQGNFVIVWDSATSATAYSSDHRIRAQRFDENGATLDGEFQVNTYTPGYQIGYTLFPAVAADRRGDFVVAWHNLGSSGTDTNFQSFQARRYDVDGAPRGGQFQVNTYTTSSQFYGAVAMDGQGNFVIAWESGGSNGTDYEIGSSIQARRYDALFRDDFETGGTIRWSPTVP